MRIVGGEKRSRLLTAPEGTETRPTADKVREALFNILQSRVYDAHVLDLYAGSGALALEALSRGAADAVLCDQDRKAAAAIRKNIAALAYGDRTCFLQMPDAAALSAVKREGRRFDLIFLDPPYRMDTAPVCERLLDDGLLAPDARIVIEHRKETPPALSERFEVISVHHYGITGLTVCRAVREEG